MESLQLGEKCADLDVRPAEGIEKCVLVDKLALRQPPPEIVLHDAAANDDVAKHNLISAVGAERDNAADADDERELDVGETRTAVGGDGGGAGLAHAGHVCENDIVTAHSAGRICVGVAHGFAVSRDAAVPVVVED